MKIELVETKCCVLQIITIIWVIYVQNDFLFQTLIIQLMTKYQIFKKLPQILHIHKNHNFLGIGIIQTNSFFFPINFMAGTCQECKLM